MAPGFTDVTPSVFVTERSAPAPTVVGSVARSFAAFPSPAVATRAMFVTAGTAPARTLTFTVTVLVPLIARGPGLVQVTTWPAMPQPHPEPLAPVGVRPAGTESMSVSVPKVAALPAFVTIRV